jgi:hypothetical protein
MYVHTDKPHPGDKTHEHRIGMQVVNVYPVEKCMNQYFDCRGDQFHWIFLLSDSAHARTGSPGHRDIRPVDGIDMFRACLVSYSNSSIFFVDFDDCLK